MYLKYKEYKRVDLDNNFIIPKNWSLTKIKYETINLDYKRIPLSSEIRGNMVKKLYDYYGASGIIDKVEDYIFDETLILLGEDGANLYSRNSPLAFLAKGKYWVNNHAHILKTINGNIFYFVYLLESLDYTIYITGAAQPKLTADNLANIKIPLPPLPEQKTIAAFLDHKTALIDKLISLKEQQIALLTEQRVALINHAVTRGLDAKVKLKNSGVEWLGEVPEHWDIRRTKYIFKIQKRIVGELGHNVLSITQKGIKIKDTESGEGQLSMDYSKYQIVNKGDFAMNHMDLLTGYVDISKYDGVTSPDYRVFTLRDKNSNDRYFLYIFQMCYNNKIFYGHGQGSSQLGRWRFPRQAFLDFYFPLPSFSEQSSIADFLDKKTNDIDHIISKNEILIKFLKEYRTALITEAVSGQIDVRGWGKK